MKGGCFRNFFAIVGCFTVMVVGGLGTWYFWPQIVGTYQSIRGTTPPAAPTVGVPSDAAYRSAERKEASIARRGGAGYVKLSADEMASLIARRLSPGVQQVTDSITVTLYPERLVLEGQILLDVFGRDVLGPLVEFLGSRQPVKMGGGVTVRGTGQVAWNVDEFVIRAFPFPGSAIPRLVNRMTGDTLGAFPIPVPETVGEVHVEPDGVTFYRKVQ